MSVIWWAPQVISMPSLEMRRSRHGGYMKPSWGRVGFAPDTYPSGPPRKAQIDLHWGLSFSGSVRLFDGTIVLRSMSTEQINYDIFEPQFEQKLLAQGVDIKNNDVDLPLVIGDVVHVNPQRTGQASEQRYYLPDFAGFIGSGINAYDDGVLINDSWTDNEDGTVSRSVNLVGELTFSGTGNKATMLDVFSWACSELGLSLDSDLARDVELDCVITSQQYVIDFLDELAWYCDHGYYILDGVLHLISNNDDNGSQRIGLGEGEMDPVQVSYSWPQPVKKMSARWQTRHAVTDSDGSRIESEDHDVELFSEFNIVGTDENVSRVYNTDTDVIRERLQVLLDRMNMPRIEIEIPLYRLPRYGERIDFTDEVSVIQAEGYVRCREYSLDYKAKTVRVIGDGEVTYT